MKSEENFLFGLVTHTSLGVSAFANHRGISPSPVGTLTRPMRSQEFLMLLLLYYKSTAIPSCVGDGSKVENRDGSKVNWDNLHGKMSEDVGPYKIGRFFKDPEF